MKTGNLASRRFQFAVVLTVSLFSQGAYLLSPRRLSETTMKRFPLVLFLLFSLPTPSSAMFVMIPPLEDLVCDSDLIVVGTLSSVNEYSKDGTDYGEGLITVAETIWGAVNPGETLTLKWFNESGIVCPRVEHGQHADKEGIWLLTLSSDGEVRANYTERFVNLDHKDEVMKILARKKTCVRMARHPEFGEPVTVSLVFRNPTQDETRFPGLEFHDGCLYISPDVILKLRDGSGYCCNKIDLLPHRVFVSDDVAPIVVGANQEHRITLDLRQVFDLNAPAPYTFRFKVRGFERGNDCEFYFNPTERPVRNDSDEQKIAEAKSTPVYSLWPALGIIAALGSFSLYRRRARR
jgi:hypothetical protein